MLYGVIPVPPGRSAAKAPLLTIPTASGSATGRPIPAPDMRVGLVEAGYADGSRTDRRSGLGTRNFPDPGPVDGPDRSTSRTAMSPPGTGWNCGVRRSRFARSPAGTIAYELLTRVAHLHPSTATRGPAGPSNPVIFRPWRQHLAIGRIRFMTRLASNSDLRPSCVLTATYTCASDMRVGAG